VSRQLRTRATLVRASQQVRGGWSFPAHADPSRGMCNWPSIPSPRYRPIARRDAEIDAKHWNVWFARSPLLQPETWQPTGYGSAAVQLRRHPYIGALQTSVYLERQFSRIFPAHPRSLASVLFPRPAARRVSASHCVRPCGFRLSENLVCNERKKIFRTFRKRRRLALGSGAHSHPTTHKSCVGDPGISRRFAQECPEGNPGKFKQEKSNGTLHQHRYSERLPR
jgi:hypothetical protein